MVVSCAHEAADTSVSGPRFTAEANLVLLDVTAVNEEGRPVDSLQKTDFRVSEDGADQEALVYAIGFFDPSESTISASFQRRGREELQRLAEETSGMAYFPENMRRCKQAGRDIAEQIAQETRVGDHLLPAGEYRIQHKADGTDHYVLFRQIDSRDPIEPVRAKCELEMLPSKAPYTAVFTRDGGSLARLTKVEIAGENVAHVF